MPPDERIFQPLPPGHPAIGTACGICTRPLEAGAVTTLIPKNSPPAHAATVEAVLCHEACVRLARTAARCRGCNAPIIWRKTEAGKNTPDNLDGTPHWATCPKAAAFKGRARA